MVLEEAHPFTPKPLYLKYDGDFSMDDFYNTIFSWFNRHRFKWSEKRFKEKPSSLKGSEIKVDVYGDRKKTEFYKYVFDIHVFILEYYERDIIVNGKKTKMGNGKLQVTVNGWVLLDYKNKFPTGKQKGLIGKFYAFLGNIKFSY